MVQPHFSIYLLFLTSVFNVPPSKTVYFTLLSPHIITPSGEINCSENSNECKRSTCECDAEFARQLSATWLDQRWNNFYWTHKKNPSQKEELEGSIMEYESSCSSSGNNVSPSDSCCGEYPNRIPYSSANKDCCNKSSKLFNSAVQSCCEDGSIRVAC